VNLHGPVRAAESAGPGVARVTISFDAWKEGQVAPTSRPVFVLRPKTLFKPEPVSPRLVRSLVHPVPDANLLTIHFSEDGTKLVAAGYPSGVVQLWDTASWKELRRIESPPGLRGSANYAVLSSDWKTLYVPIEGDKYFRGEKDGKRVGWRAYNGSVRIWDLTTGEEQPPIETPGRGPFEVVLAPDGRTMIMPMASSGNADKYADRVTEIWDLTARTGRRLCEGYGEAAFAPDGKTVAVLVNDYNTKTSVLSVYDPTSLKELARHQHQYDDADGRSLSSPQFTPDGRTVLVQLGSKKGATPTLWFFDAKTLKKTDELTGEPDSESYGWFSMLTFARDGTRMVAFDGAGMIGLYDLATRSRIRRWTVEPKFRAMRLAFDWERNRAFVPMQPKWDTADFGDEPNPKDLPQPRVFVLDLESDAGKPAEVLIAPHGYLGAVAVSPDGKTVAFGGSGGVHLFDVSDLPR
jgi:WD40 repeat protein